MKTNLKLRLASLIVVEQPLLSATIAVFFFAIIMMAISAIFQDYLLATKIAKYFFWAIALLGIAHLAATKLFVTWFSRNKHRIPLLYYGGKVRIYNRPVFKKIPYAEIIFPDDWDVTHIIGQHQTSLLIGLAISSQEIFLLQFDLKAEVFGEFKAHDLEKLIALQKEKFPNQKRFEFIDCLQDFLITDCRRNHHSIKFLLTDYHLGQLNLKLLENGVLQMVKIPNLFTNVKKMELNLTAVQRMIKTNPTVQMFPLNRAAAVL
ncbi:MAG: hypothetical protein WCW61_04775 [Patescibacteria group bacterium]|jgi:hypothetical protein